MFPPHEAMFTHTGHQSDYWNINVEYKRCYRLLAFRLCWLFILQAWGRVTRLNTHCADTERPAEPQVTSYFDGARTSLEDVELTPRWPSRHLHSFSFLTVFYSASQCLSRRERHIFTSQKNKKHGAWHQCLHYSLQHYLSLRSCQTVTGGKERGRLKHRRREREIQTVTERIINAQCVFWWESSGRRPMSSQTATLMSETREE